MGDGQWMKLDSSDDWLLILPPPTRRKTIAKMSLSLYRAWRFAEPDDLYEDARPSRAADKEQPLVRMQLLVKTVTRSGDRHSIEWVECEPARRPLVRVRVKVSVSLPPALAGPQLPARSLADRPRPGGEGEADLHGQLGEDHF